MYAMHIGSLDLRGLWWPKMCTSEHVQFMGMIRVQGSLSPANIVHSHKVIQKPTQARLRAHLVKFKHETQQ
jgi:hypothetical protein